VCKKLSKNTQPFGKKCQKTWGGVFFDSHCMLTAWHSASCTGTDPCRRRICLNIEIRLSQILLQMLCCWVRLITDTFCTMSLMSGWVKFTFSVFYMVGHLESHLGCKIPLQWSSDISCRSWRPIRCGKWLLLQWLCMYAEVMVRLVCRCV